MASKVHEYKDALDAVEGGDESAKTKLAWYMLSGYGGADVDADGAVALLEERVKDRDAKAMWILGVCCEYGIGTEQDFERAQKLYGQSSGRGNEIGKNLLKNGELYEKGSGYLRIKRL